MKKKTDSITKKQGKREKSIERISKKSNQGKETDLSCNVTQSESNYFIISSQNRYGPYLYAKNY